MSDIEPLETVAFALAAEDLSKLDAVLDTDLATAFRMLYHRRVQALNLKIVQLKALSDK